MNKIFHDYIGGIITSRNVFRKKQCVLLNAIDTCRHRGDCQELRSMLLKEVKDAFGVEFCERHGKLHSQVENRYGIKGRKIDHRTNALRRNYIRSRINKRILLFLSTPILENTSYNYEKGLQKSTRDMVERK